MDVASNQPFPWKQWREFQRMCREQRKSAKPQAPAQRTGVGPSGSPKESESQIRPSGPKPKKN